MVRVYDVVVDYGHNLLRYLSNNVRAAGEHIIAVSSPRVFPSWIFFNIFFLLVQYNRQYHGSASGMYIVAA